MTLTGCSKLCQIPRYVKVHAGPLSDVQIVREIKLMEYVLFPSRCSLSAPAALTSAFAFGFKSRSRTCGWLSIVLLEAASFVQDNSLVLDPLASSSLQFH